jgi:hypothetical protein
MNWFSYLLQTSPARKIRKVKTKQENSCDEISLELSRYLICLICKTISHQIDALNRFLFECHLKVQLSSDIWWAGKLIKTNMTNVWNYQKQTSKQISGIQGLKTVPYLIEVVNQWRIRHVDSFKRSSESLRVNLFFRECSIGESID